MQMKTYRVQAILDKPKGNQKQQECADDQNDTVGQRPISAIHRDAISECERTNL
jgi:hypothetical protein